MVRRRSVVPGARLALVGSALWCGGIVSAPAAPSGVDLLQEPGVRGGAWSTWAVADGAQTAGLRVGEAFVVWDSDTDPGKVALARTGSRQVSGPVTIAPWNGQRLP